MRSEHTSVQAASTHRGSIAEMFAWLAVLAGLLAFSTFPLVAEASEQRTFQPQGCEFKASISRDAEVKSGWRGEHLMTTAVQKGRDGVVRASCGSYYIRDWCAFRAQLPGQLERAARLAGIDKPQTEIRRTAMGTVASYWGFRGTGSSRTYFRSDSYVGDRSYMEVVVLAPVQTRHSPEAYRVLASVRR